MRDMMHFIVGVWESSIYIEDYRWTIGAFLIVAFIGAMWIGLATFDLARRANLFKVFAVGLFGFGNLVIAASWLVIVDRYLAWSVVIGRSPEMINDRTMVPLLGLLRHGEMMAWSERMLWLIKIIILIHVILFVVVSLFRLATLIYRSIRHQFGKRFGSITINSAPLD